MPNEDWDAAHTILKRLRDELQQTKALYEGASEEHDRAMERMQNLGMTPPDGSIRHATRVYNFTLKAFRLALWRYNRYLIDGKLPDKEPPKTWLADTNRY